MSVIWYALCLYTLVKTCQIRSDFVGFLTLCFRQIFIISGNSSLCLSVWLADCFYRRLASCFTSKKIVIGQVSAARLIPLNPCSIKFQKMFTVKNAFLSKMIGLLVSSYPVLPLWYCFIPWVLWSAVHLGLTIRDICFLPSAIIARLRRSIWQFKICFSVIPHFLRDVRQLLAQKHFTYLHRAFFQLALNIQYCPERCYFSSFCTKRAPSSHPCLTSRLLTSKLSFIGWQQLFTRHVCCSKKRAEFGMENI